MVKRPKLKELTWFNFLKVSISSVSKRASVLWCDHMFLIQTAALSRDINMTSLFLHFLINVSRLNVLFQMDDSLLSNYPLFPKIENYWSHMCFPFTSLRHKQIVTPQRLVVTINLLHFPINTSSHPLKGAPAARNQSGFNLYWETLLLDIFFSLIFCGISHWNSPKKYKKYEGSGGRQLWE